MPDENRAISIVDERPLTSTQIVSNAALVQEVREKLMKRDIHYGVIPGTDKPTLYKPGAELLCSVFRLSPEIFEADLSTADEIRYRVKVRLMSASGRFVGEGAGECSSNEEKYKWRKAVCEEEWNETPEARRRQKWAKDGTKTKQIRTQPADVANTILKMAVKRGLVAVTLTATAASDTFAQDLEDLMDIIDADYKVLEAARPPIPRPVQKAASQPAGQPTRQEPPPSDAQDAPPAVPAAQKAPNYLKAISGGSQRHQRGATVWFEVALTVEDRGKVVGVSKDEAHHLLGVSMNGLPVLVKLGPPAKDGKTILDDIKVDDTPPTAASK